MKQNRLTPTDMLLSISNEIARIKGKAEMLHLICYSLKQYIGFDDGFIMRYDKLTRTFRAYLYHVAEGWASNSDFQVPVGIDDALNDESLLNNTPVVWDVDSLISDGSRPVAFFHNSGIKEFVTLKLMDGNEWIGLLVLLSEKKKSFTKEDLELLKKIGYPISLATAHIIAKEEIENREEEKKLLLALSNKIAALRNREDLLMMMNEKRKKLFSIKYYWIYKVNDDAETFSVFVRNTGEEIDSPDDYTKIITMNFSLSDQFYKEVMNAAQPGLYAIEELTKRPDLPPYVYLWKRSGIHQVLIVALRVGGASIGTAVFSLEEGTTIDTESILLKGICSQLAVAVSNIIANEKLQEREAEKSILLSLSNEIAALKSREDFFHVVNNRIKKLFQISEFGIAQIDENGKTYSAFALEFDERSRNHPDFGRVTGSKYDVDDPIFTTVMNSDGPVLFSVDEMAGQPGMPVYVELWKTAGFRYFLTVPLRVGGASIGFVNFHLEKSNLISTKSILLTGVCDQLAVAVSNILANEKINRREEEKSLLLSLSNEIAALKSRDDLFKVVNGKIKQLFGIKELGFSTIDEGGETYSIFLIDVQERIRSHPDFSKIITARFDVHDPLYSVVMSLEDPIEYEVDELMKLPDMPPYVSIWKQTGVEKVAIFPLRAGGVCIGTVLFILEKEFEFNIGSTLLKGVCSQLAVTISNILSNEEIRGRELEKSKLLEFSNAMASVRDKQVLGKILKLQLKDLFGVEDYVIHALSKDKKTHRPVLFDPEADFAQHPDFQQLLHTDTDVNDGVFNTILNAEGMVTFNVEEWFNAPKPPSYSNAAKSVGLRKMGGIAIRLGEENIGVMNFRKDGIDAFTFQRSIFKSICSQLAIAISNISANDEIKGREEEKTMLLEFSNAIASVRDKDVFAKILKHQLKELFGIDDYAIYELSEDKNKYRHLLYDPASDFASTPGSALSSNEFKDITQFNLDGILSAEGPVELNKVQWEHFINPSGLAKGNGDNEEKEILGMPLRLGHENIGILLFISPNSRQFLTQKKLFKSICSQLAISVFNFLANEKISHQLLEIENYRQQLEEEKVYLKEEIEINQNYSEIVGESPAIKKVFRMVSQVAHTDSTVLLLGETGTGKELIARAIHNASPRRNKLMIKINCAALPANLIESELFGHERGSFTGAVDRRVGKFELANNGTLFLDEIGEMPLELQVKLLRALQEKEIERIGGKTTIKTDVRIIAATNRDLEKLMDEGKFRSDLYYRLNIFPIQLPPLRERREDIQTLALHFIKRFSKKTGKNIHTLSRKALQLLQNYDWPGNIRELEHLIERSVLLATGESITEIHLPIQKVRSGSHAGLEDFKIQTIFDYEKEYILKVLKHADGRVSGKGGAAELLGIPASTLNSRMKKLGIRRQHHAD